MEGAEVRWRAAPEGAGAEASMPRAGGEQTLRSRQAGGNTPLTIPASPARLCSSRSNCRGAG